MKIGLIAKYYLVLTVLILDLSYLLSQFLIFSKNPGSDFIHFYNSAIRMQTGQSVFFPGGDTLAFSSALTYFFFIPLTAFPIELASNIFICINYVLMILTVFLVFKLVEKKIDLNFFTVVFTLLIFSFPSRSIIGNGTIGYLVIVSSLSVFMNSKNRKYSVSGIYLYVLFELKIYLALPILLFYAISKNLAVLKSFLLSLLIGQFFIFLVNPSGTLFYYFKLLLQRASTVDTEIDQMAIQNILINFQLHATVSWLFAILFYAFTIKKLRDFAYSKPNYSLIFALIPLISFYFHRQDALFGVIAICIYLLTKPNIFWMIFPLILLGNYGNKSLIFALLINLLLIGALALLGVGAQKILFVSLSCTLLQLFQIYILNHYGWQSSYILWSALGFLFQFSAFSTILNSHKLERR
jgi:hypothetical protein